MFGDDANNTLFEMKLNCSGNFLDDYSNKSNLHIAVTDSKGDVFEFDRFADFHSIMQQAF